MDNSEKVEIIKEFAKWEEEQSVNYQEFDDAEEVVERYLLEVRK